jgi:hypothetical protein
MIRTKNATAVLLVFPVTGVTIFLDKVGVQRGPNASTTPFLKNETDRLGI